MKKLLTCLAVGAALAFSGQPVAAKTPANALVMAYQFDDIITLDPAEVFEFTAAEYAGNTYDRLIGYDVNDVSKIFGVAAESWTISEDGKTYTFKMRPGIKFTTGNPMTAHDAAFSLQRAIVLDKSPAKRAASSPPVPARISRMSPPRVIESPAETNSSSSASRVF